MSLPDFSEIFDLAVSAACNSIRVALPGIVTDVHKRSVTVQPELRRVRTDPTLEPDTYPPLLSVPVIRLGSLEYGADFQLAKGDRGLIIFADGDLGTWLDQGGISTPAKGVPHDVNGAVFVPGFFPVSDAPVLPAGARFGERTGEGLEVISGEVRAGYGATESAILGDSFASHLDTYLAAMDVFADALSALPGMGAPAATFKVALALFRGQIPGDLAKVAKVK